MANEHPRRAAGSSGGLSPEIIFVWCALLVLVLFWGGFTLIVDSSIFANIAG